MSNIELLAIISLLIYTLYMVVVFNGIIIMTTETSTSVSLLLFVTDRNISSKLYDNRDDFDFRIVNHYICSNIPESLYYGVYISQLVMYTRACSSCVDFIDRGKLLTKKLVDQGYTLEKMKTYFRKFFLWSIQRSITTLHYPEHCV